MWWWWSFQTVLKCFHKHRSNDEIFAENKVTRPVHSLIFSFLLDSSDEFQFKTTSSV